MQIGEQTDIDGATPWIDTHYRSIAKVKEAPAYRIQRLERGLLRRKCDRREDIPRNTALAANRLLRCVEAVCKDIVCARLIDDIFHVDSKTAHLSRSSHSNADAGRRMCN